MPRTWVQSSDGVLIRADAITGVRCSSGAVEAWWRGEWVRLAGPGCPPDFHEQLVAELADLDSSLRGRWGTIVTADLAPDRAAWICKTTLESAIGASTNAGRRG